LAEPGGADPLHVADVAGELVQQLDGDGAFAQLVANYIALFLGAPLIEFRASDDFATARTSAPAMKLFILDKFRETLVHPLTGVLFRRVQSYGAADRYVNDAGEELICEYHLWLPTIRKWSTECGLPGR
jgi:hypothetical protein